MTSRLNELVEAAWPTVDAALTTGLKEPDGNALGKLVALVDRPADLMAHVTFRWTGHHVSAGFEQKELTVDVGTIHELRSHENVARDELDPAAGPALGDRMAEWATATRAGERQWMLRQLVDQSAESPTAFDVEALHGLRRGSRVVAFASIDGLDKACKAAGVDLVDCTHALGEPGARLLSFPIDEVVASRLEDLTASWDLGDHGMVVRLTERIELRFSKATAHGHLRRYSAVGPFPT